VEALNNNAVTVYIANVRPQMLTAPLAPIFGHQQESFGTRRSLVKHAERIAKPLRLIA
jgi:hypothetical protein